MNKRQHRGSILVGVLWCLTLLSIIVVGVLYTTRMDMRLVKNYGDRIQAHYLALAGAERAKAVIYKDCVTRRQTSASHNGAVYDDPTDFRDLTLGRGKYSVLHPGSDPGSQVVYGVSDEESLLNANTISTNEFSKIPDMPSEIAAAIISWRSASNAVVAGGVGSDYYATLQPPSEPRNGPMQTVREMLMIKDVTKDLLLGSPSETEPVNDALTSELGGFLNDGWAAYLTVFSTDKNISANGDDRINIQNADETTLSGVQGIDRSTASAIVAYRGRQQFQTIVDLMDVTASQPGATGANASANSGSPVISQQLFEDIADHFTVDDQTDETGLININTASADVLQCLPGIDNALAQAVISRRQSGGYFTSIAGLLEVQGITRDILKQLAPLITARSETFRIISEGRISSSGARQRIETVIHVSPQEVRTLAYREDL